MADYAKQGYRRISRKYGMISRIDRPDWKEHLAAKHSPWDPEAGMKWVNGIGDGMAADFYRRVHSEDVLEIGAKEALSIPTSNHDPIGYVPKDGEQSG